MLQFVSGTLSCNVFQYPFYFEWENEMTIEQVHPATLLLFIEDEGKYRLGTPWRKSCTIQYRQCMQEAGRRSVKDS